MNCSIFYRIILCSFWLCSQSSRWAFNISVKHLSIVFLLLLLNELVNSLTLFGDCAVLAVEVHVVGVATVLHVPSIRNRLSTQWFSPWVKSVSCCGSILAKLKEIPCNTIWSCSSLLRHLKSWEWLFRYWRPITDARLHGHRISIRQ